MASSGEFQLPIDGWFMGRVKSYQPGTGYGFIECEETYRYFRRDVYLRRHQLEQLDIRTVPMGTDILFRVVVPDGKPQACDLAFPGAGKDMWSGQKGYSTSFCEDEAGQQKQGPRTDVEPTMKQCEHGLNGFKNCLQTLAMSLELHGLSDESFKALRQADAALRCVQCRRDERTEGSKILLLLEREVGRQRQLMPPRPPQRLGAAAQCASCAASRDAHLKVKIHTEHSQQAVPAWPPCRQTN